MHFPAQTLRTWSNPGMVVPAGDGRPQAGEEGYQFRLSGSAQETKKQAS